MDFVMMESGMTQFKSGDRVRCIDDEGSSILILGKIYTVFRDQEVESEVVIEIANRDPGRYHADRFELVKEDCKKPFTAIHNQLYFLMVSAGVHYQAEAWAAGIRGEAPVGWERVFEELKLQNDPEYKEFLRLKEKFKSINA